MTEARVHKIRQRSGSPSHQTGRENIFSNTFTTIMVWADAFAGYDRLLSAEREGGPLAEAACWTHMRRKIHDVYISIRATKAEETLKRIGELCAIEEAIRGLPAAERLTAKQSRSKLLLASLHEWLVEKSATLSKKSQLCEAFAYALNHWDALFYYSNDGLAEPDNNAAERALRAVCFGEKNYISFGSELGALQYGLIVTCGLNGINAVAYLLRHVLSVLPEWSSKKVTDLLTWNVDLTNKINSRQCNARLTLKLNYQIPSVVGKDSTQKGNNIADYIKVPRESFGG